MPCRPIIDGDGRYIGFACSRGSSIDSCSCGGRGEYLCDYPLKGSKKGQTCSRPLCRQCAKLIRKTAKGSIHYCPAHQRMAEKEAENAVR